MSIDTAREALHRIALEMGIATALDPHLIATAAIQNVQRTEVSIVRLQMALEVANKRLETLGETAI